MTDLAPRSEANWQSPAPTQAITAHRYTSTDYMQHEWERVWPKTWLFAALVGDLKEPGEYVVFNLGHESILISCDDQGEVGAFYNVCQHRGARVMVNDRGWVKNFVCPYHGWTYDNAGQLAVVPDEDRFASGVDCDERSLKPLRCEVWAGMVWVCMDEEAPPLADYLGPLVDLIEPYRTEEMTLVTDQSVSLHCNWKAVFDNFGELYHVEHIHPQHATIFDCPTADVGLYRQGHTGVFIDGFTVNSRLPIPEMPTPHMSTQMKKLGMDPEDYRGRVLDVRKDVQAARREVGPRLGYDYELLTDEQLSDIVQFNFFPNTMITIQPDDMLIMRARPHPTDPNQCWWDKYTFMMTPEGGEESAGSLSFTPRNDPRVNPGERVPHDDFTQEQIISGEKTMTITIDQDIHLIRDVQAGMRSRGFDNALLSDEEIRVTHYHQWLDHYMGETGADPVVN
ncbi:MAG: aromatic ring-hydroxylating oxygenase subunit alpha [Acidimicrobiales bacterium]